MTWLFSTFSCDSPGIVHHLELPISQAVGMTDELDLTWIFVIPDVDRHVWEQPLRTEKLSFEPAPTDPSMMSTTIEPDPFKPKCSTVKVCTFLGNVINWYEAVKVPSFSVILKYPVTGNAIHITYHYSFQDTSYYQPTCDMV